MRQAPRAGLPKPQFLGKAEQLAAYLKTLSAAELGKAMHLSPTLAQKTHGLIAGWTAEPSQQSPAATSFVGDIYSGLRAHEFTAADRAYATKHLRILSGLYGCLRPFDGIYPYRLEMGYALPAAPFANLYKFWGASIAESLPKTGPIINTSSQEYSRVVTNYIGPARIITPQFLTINAKTGQPAFAAVHAKIARGAFARWLIVNRVENSADFAGFTDLGYEFSRTLSTPGQPAFVCRTFQGLGLSIRKK